MANLLQNVLNDDNSSEVYSDQGNPSMNPLLIDLVVENILKYLNFVELKVCRSLNNFWKEKSDTIFLKHCSLLLLDNKSEDNADQNHRISIANYMDIFSNPKHPHPYADILRRYRNFSVDNLDKMEDVPMFQNFVLQVGPQMTSLDVNDGNIIKERDILSDLICSRYTPYLESLCLDLHDIKVDEDQNEDEDEDEDEAEEYLDEKSTSNEKAINNESINNAVRKNMHLRCLRIYNKRNYEATSLVWQDVLSLYPKLKTFGLYCFSETEYENIFTALVELRKKNNNHLKLAELTCLNINAWDDEDIELQLRFFNMGKLPFGLLEAANLPLEAFRFNDQVKDDLAFVSFMKAQATKGTLKKLSMCWNQDECFEFPRLESLEEITVNCCSIFKVLPQLPNFTSLTLDVGNVSDKNEWCDFLAPRKTFTPVLTLKTFKCDDWGWPELSDLPLLFSWMPNVTDLEMWMDNETFPWICQHLPGLKHLTVQGWHLSDSGVVGDIEVESDEDEHCYRITDLQELETFRMHNYHASFGLTIRSIWSGFIGLKKLKTLVITVNEKFTSDEMETLNTLFSNLTVNIALQPIIMPEIVFPDIPYI